MDSHRLHFKTFMMILVMIVAGPLRNVLLGKGMQSVGATSVASASELGHVIGSIARNPFDLVKRSVAAHVFYREHIGAVVGRL